MMESVNKLAHYFAGFLSGGSIIIHPVLPVIGFLGFFLYELNGELRKDDWFDEELREYMCGFFIAVILLLVISQRMPLLFN